MAKLLKLTSVIVILMAFVIGCQNNMTPVEPETRTSLALFTLPEGAWLG